MAANPSRHLIAVSALAPLIFCSGVAAATECQRELSTDRPDKTESPYTVETGHFQFEIDLFNYSCSTIETEGGNEEFRVLGGSINAKVGISRRVDVQLICGWERIEAGSNEGRTGPTDPVVRIKLNLIGNDHGRVAIGLMPFGVIPHNTSDELSDRWQGGLIIPLAVDFGHSFGLGLMHEVDLVADDDSDGRHWEYVASATVARDITDNAGVYVELFQAVSLAGHQTWAPTLDAGLTVGLGANLQLDAGVNYGLNRWADDLNPFVGVTVRK